MTDDRASRSVFVGNIPYEATEEALKEIFNQAGTVVSFRLVYDRETGKPKGYGFCEYADVETAQSAMRNLNNYDFSGRQLRVGIATGEQNKEEERKSMLQASGGPLFESPYGESVESEKAPEAISRAVASLPPEQMFELMKQMKLCIQNNPNEARNMLLQNPQLAYALLQAQIVMKIVDPQVALAMLHRQVEQIPPVQPSASTAAQPAVPAVSQPPPPAAAAAAALNQVGPMTGAYASPVGDGSMVGPSAQMRSSAEFGGVAVAPRPRGGLLGDMPPGTVVGPLPGPPLPTPDHQGHMGELRGPVGGPAIVAPVMRDPGAHIDPRAGSRVESVEMRGRVESRDPRQAAVRVPVSGVVIPTARSNISPAPAGPSSSVPVAAVAASPAPGTRQDQEKAQLIMQVLQLSDEQIAMLPPDQRQSILILKEQIARSTAQN